MHKSIKMKNSQLHYYIFQAFHSWRLFGQVSILWKQTKVQKIRETFFFKIKKKCWHFVFVIILSVFRFSGKIFVLLCLKMQPITLVLVIKTSVKVQKMQERSWDGDKRYKTFLWRWFYHKSMHSVTIMVLYFVTNKV